MEGFICQGKCPKCSCDDLDYEPAEFDAVGDMFYEFTCKKCRAQGKEYYTVEYSETLLD